MSVYRLEVRKADDLLKVGTAWQVTTDLLVTAYHVVGEDLGKWYHTIVEGAEYHLVDGGQVIDRGLSPIADNSYEDIAILRSSRPLRGPALRLAATDPADDSRWSSDGFPSVTGKRIFRLTGRVAAVQTNSRHGLQLTIDQGGSVSWEGASGSPVCVQDRVIGILTQEISGLNTVRAARVADLKKMLVGLGIYEAAALAQADEEPEPEKRNYHRALDQPSLEAYRHSDEAKSRKFYDMMAELGEKIGVGNAGRVMNDFFSAMRRFEFGRYTGIVLSKKKEYDIAGFIEILELRAAAIIKHLDSIISGRLQLIDYSLDSKEEVLPKKVATEIAARWKQEFIELHNEHVRAIRDQQLLLAHETRGQIAQLLEVVWASTHSRVPWIRGIYSSH